VSLKIGICKSSWTQNGAAPNLGRFIVLLAGGVYRRTPQRNGKNCNPQQERADADSLADAQHRRRCIRRGQERYNACDSVTSDAIEDRRSIRGLPQLRTPWQRASRRAACRGHNVRWHRSVATEVQRE
jgi:hypothetical protein